MAGMPEIVLPSSLPAWLIDGHESQLEDAYAHVQMRTGHHRLRRVYRRPPEVRSVSLQLLEEQAATFHAWFEHDLLAGEREFAARVAHRGPGVVWYAARFLGDPPYDAEPLHLEGGVGWRIQARLLLSGQPQAFPPVLSAMSATTTIGLRGRARGTSTADMSATTVVDLVGEVLDMEVSS